MSRQMPFTPVVMGVTRTSEFKDLDRKQMLLVKVYVLHLFVVWRFYSKLDGT